MTECDIPGCDGDNLIPFTCNECGRTYCTDHRLPEKHLCSQLRNLHKNLDDLFATGLQDKPGKKRGLTNRTTETNSPPNTPNSSHSKADESAPSATTQSDASADSEKMSVDPVGKTIQLISSLYETVRRAVWSFWILARHKFKTMIRVVGLTLVVVGGIRLFSSDPLNTQPALFRRPKSGC